MNTLHIIHHIHDKALRKALPILYLAATIRTALFSFLSIFIPIYYFQTFIGLGFSQQQALFSVIGLFIVIYSVYIPTIYVSARINARLSTKIAFLIGGFLLFLYIALLIIAANFFVLWLSGIILGLHLAFWWHTYHLTFADNGKEGEFGKEIGTAEGLGMFVGILTPLIAGKIIQENGYSVLFVLSLTILIPYLIVLSFIRTKHKALDVTPPIIKREVQKYRSDFVGYFGVGGELAVATILWPLFLFLVFKNPFAVGIITSVIAFTALISKVLAGRLSDTIKPEKLTKLGVITVSMSWAGKLLFPQPAGILFFDTMHKVLSSFLYLPAMAFAYFRAFTENRNAYILVRQAAYEIGKIIVLIGAFFIVFFGFPLWVTLIFGIISPLFAFVLQKKSGIMRK